MSDDDQKHLDATKPGLLPVSHTSKPALVNNQQLSKDPMMRDEDKKDDKPELSKKSLVLKPTITKESLKKDETIADNLAGQSSTAGIFYWTPIEGDGVSFSILRSSVKGNKLWGLGLSFY